MADGWWVFVGPYAEWTYAVSGFDPDDPRGDYPRWNELFHGLRWNIGHNYGLARRNGQLVEVPCCAPNEPRAGCPRWPMWVESQYDQDFSGAEAVTDWTGTDPRAEVAWFTAAFAEDLALAEDVIGHAPQIQWGLLWVTW
jgi:hypothetical protein